MTMQNEALALAFGLWWIEDGPIRRTRGARPLSRRRFRRRLRREVRAVRRARRGPVWSVSDVEARAAALVLPEDTFGGFLVFLHSDQGGCRAVWCEGWYQTLVVGARFRGGGGFGPTAVVKTVPVSRGLVERIWDVQGDLASGL